MSRNELNELVAQWTLATAVAWALFMPFFTEVAWTLLMPFLVHSFLAVKEVQDMDADARFATSMLIAGLMIALCQWVVLRRLIQDAWWWIVYTVGGVPLYLGVLYLFAPTIPWYESPSLVLLVPVGALPVTLGQGWLLARGRTGRDHWMVIVVWGIARCFAAAAAVFALVAAFFVFAPFLGIEEMDTTLTPLFRSKLARSMAFGAMGGGAFGLVSSYFLAWILAKKP